MSRQSCRRNLVRIRDHRSYTTRELAETLKVHVRTVQIWHRNGLAAIDENDRPYLFLGKTAKQYLTKRRASSRCKLRANECYCLKCRQGVEPPESTISILRTSYKVGESANLIIIKGICPQCMKNVARIVSSESIKQTIWAGYVKTTSLNIKGYSEA